MPYPVSVYCKKHLLQCYTKVLLWISYFDLHAHISKKPDGEDIKEIQPLSELDNSYNALIQAELISSILH